ncbi:MAG: acyl-CoA dehydrogenase family protein [Polyangiaceae bacterium]
MSQPYTKGLCQGTIAEDTLFPYPLPSRGETEHLHALLSQLRRFGATSVDSAKIDRDAEVPKNVLEGLANLGVFGASLPKEFGGLGLSHTGFARMMEEISGIDASLGVTVGAHLSLAARSLVLYGTREQKEKYLPAMARGEALGAFALSEEGAGSDPAALRSYATLKSEGYVLRGDKAWVTNGPTADVFILFARTSPPDTNEKPRITAFVASRSDGVRSTDKERKLGVRGNGTSDLSFDGVVLPKEAVLAEPGRGFKVAMEVLNEGRVTLAAGAIGIAKRIIRLAINRVQERRAFGRSIGEFGLIKDKIATMVAEIYALESATYLTTGLADARTADYSVESAICKIMGSEVLMRVADEAVQIAAGAGYSERLPFERFLRDARVNPIFYGTSEILRCFVAMAGMQGATRDVLSVGRAVREPLKALGILSELATRKAKSALSRQTPRVSRASALLNRERDVLESYTDALASHVDRALRRHGRNLSEMQYTQRRVADMLTELYALSACIARTTRAVEERGEEGARRELTLTHIYGGIAEKRLAATTAGFDANDDELRKAAASKAYADGGYPLDIL